LVCSNALALSMPPKVADGLKVISLMLSPYSFLPETRFLENAMHYMSFTLAQNAFSV